MALINVKTLGGFGLTDASGDPLIVSAKKARALFAYLSMHVDQPLSRDRLASLLWDDVPDAQSRTNLRQALSTIRRALPETAKSCLETDNENVTLLSSDIETDIAQFERLSTSPDHADQEAALDLYLGDFLEGLHTKARRFEDWLTGERYRLREQAIQLLGVCLENFRRSGETNKAIRAATLLLMQDPLREDVHRALMDLYASIGRHGTAIKQYRTCQEVLRQELGVAPAAETQALFNDISNQRHAPVSAPEEQSAAGTREGTSGGGAVGATVESQPVEVIPSQELRPVTVLYIDLTEFLERGNDMDPEEFGALVVTVYSSIDECVTNFGGEVLSSAGHMVMTAFGTERTDTYDVERAIRTAIALREQSEGLEPNRVSSGSFSGGIAVGQALVNVQIQNGKIQRSLSGKVTNFASKLAAEAGPGEIWMSNAAYQPLANRLSSEAVTAPWASDYDGEPIWSIKQIHQAPKKEATRTFVGRKMERGLLLSALENCAEGGHNRVVLIRGEPGIGKTQLAEEVISAAERDGFQTNRSLLFDPGSDRRRDTIRDFVCDLLTSDGVTPKDIRHWADQIIEDGVIAPTHRLFFYDLLDISQENDDGKIYAGLSAEERNIGRSEVFHQIFAARTKSSPFLLVIEDVHWATESILRQLAALCQISRNHPVLLIMTTRVDSDPIDALWRSMAGNCALTTIDLAPFNTKEAEELAAQYPNLSSEVIRSCIERAEGNPLFLDQLLRGSGAAQIGLPQSIQTIILSRVDTLDPRDRDMLQAAAIVGQQFDLDLARHIANDLDYEPDELLNEGMLRRTSKGFLFGHALIRDAVLSTLLKSRRKNLHGRAAEWYLPDDPENAANHLAEAEDARAAETFLLAAHQAINSFRLEDALDHVIRGRNLTTDPKLIARLQLLDGHLLRETGQTTKSIEILQAELPDTESESIIAEKLIELATSLRVADRMDEALNALEQAIVHTRKDDCETLATIHFMKGNLHFPLGQIDDCLSSHAKSLEHAEKCGSPFHEAQALGGLGDAYYQRGEIHKSNEHYKRCTEIAAANGYLRLQSANMTGFGQLYTMETDAAFRDARATVELCRKVFNKRGEIVALASLMQFSYYDNALEDAANFSEMHIKKAQEIGAQRFVKEGLHMKYAVQGETGDRQGAANNLDELYKTCDATDQSYFGPWILATLAYFTPDADRRKWALKEGKALLDRGCVSHCYFHYYHLALETALETEDWADLANSRDALSAYTKTDPLPWCDYYIDRAQALMEWATTGPSEQLKDRLLQLKETANAHRMRLAVPKIDQALSAWTDT